MIDTHAHTWVVDPAFPWQPSLASVPVPETGAPDDDLLAEMSRAGVRRAVIVQPAAYGWDNRYVARCLARHPGRFSGVCLVDPHSTNAPDALRAWTDGHAFHGLRINLLDDDAVDWLLSGPARTLIEAASARGLPLLVQPLLHHIATVEQLAVSHPELTVIVDYLGPNASHDPAGVEAVRRLARVPNVVLKLLSVVGDSRWPYPHRDLVSLYRVAIESLGPDRVILGSDFPYVREQLPYADAIAWLRSEVCEDDVALLARMDATAERLWWTRAPE